MTPKFALSLSFSGITLLQRLPDGWAKVGEVALDADDLKSALRDLRAKADALSDTGGAVKLIIPNEQIRYLTLPAPGNAALKPAIETALEGATPYDVADLVYDWSQQGDELRVAAVARETLDEAESFAADHHFDPVAHVAVAPEGQFTGEVFFGAAKVWTGPAPERDSGAVVLSDRAPVPDKPAAPEATAPEVEAKVEDQQRRETAPEPDRKPAPPPEPAATEPVGDKPKGKTAPKDVGKAGLPVPDAAPAGKAAAAEPGMPVSSEAGSEEPAARAPRSARLTPASLRVPTPERGIGVAAPDIPAQAEPDSPPPAFASIRANRAAPDGADAPAKPRKDVAPLVASRLTPVAGSAKGADQPGGAKHGKASSPALTATGAEAVASLDRAAEDRPAPPPAKPEKSSGFFSRRDKDAPPPKAATPEEPAPVAAPAVKPQPKSVKTSALARRAAAAAAAKPAAASPETDELHRMTVFGARGEGRVGGKPRFLGLMLTALLLVLLVGVAAWASVFLDDGLARFFRPDTTPADAVAEEVQPRPVEDVPQPVPEPVALAALDSAISPVEDLPELPEALAQPQRPRALTEDEADATYAATGIWQRAPGAPAEPPLSNLDDLYVASIDPEVQQFDAIALPPAVAAGDPSYASPPVPAPADVVFDIDERGLVRARPEGAMNADGVLIYTGLPPVVPPRRILGETRPEVTLPETQEAEEESQSRLQDLRPRVRPGDIVEQNERASLQGRSRAELAALRPTARPAVAKLADEADVTATALAVDMSRKPLPRPRDISRIVQQARERAAANPAPEVQVAAVAPRTVAPKIPSTTSVSKQATVRNAINLRKVNLIGVYGKPASRRALVRLANGRYQKVKVGDRVDGGRVAAIGEAELRYTKGGRSIVLKMPRS